MNIILNLLHEHFIYKIEYYQIRDLALCKADFSNILVHTFINQNFRHKLILICVKLYDKNNNSNLIEFSINTCCTLYITKNIRLYIYLTNYITAHTIQSFISNKLFKIFCYNEYFKTKSRSSRGLSLGPLHYRNPLMIQPL